MANHASHAALPYPIKNARYTVLIPYLDADGDPTDPTTPDLEVSIDDGAAADAAETEATTLRNSVAMQTFSGAEMNGSCVSFAGKAASGPKTTLGTLYPRVLAAVASGVSLSAGSASGGTLTTPLGYDVTGCFVRTASGTGGGGTGGANNQARKIITYNTGTGAFTVSPNFETAIDNTTTVDILLPEGVTLGMLKALNPTTAGRTLTVSATGEANAMPLGINGTLFSAGGAFPEIGITESGTATAASTTSLTQRVGAPHGDNALVGQTILVKGTTAAAYWQVASISANVNSTRVITFEPALPVAPTGTITYFILGSAGAGASALGAIADAIWDELLSGHTTAGSAGKAVSDILAAVDTEIGTLVTNVATLVTNVATILAAVDTEVGAIKTKTDQLAFTNAGKVDAAVLAANDLAAVVREAIADALLNRNVAGGSNAGRLVKEALYKLRNKYSFSGGTGTVYGVDDTTPAFTEAVTGTPTVTAVDPA